MIFYRIGISVLTRGLLLDTNVVGEMSRADGDAVVHRWTMDVDLEHLFVSTISLGELAYGVAGLMTGRKKLVLEAWFVSLREKFSGRVIDFDLEAALIWGELRAMMRARGKERPMIDLQIAAIAIRHNFAIATENTKHFEGLGLDVINPWERDI
jgi:predicted nucleic acid-binding protein